MNSVEQKKHLSIAISPNGHLYIDYNASDQEFASTALAEKILNFFADNIHSGLLHLGLENLPNSLPASFTFWRQYSHLFVAEICKSCGPSEDVTKISLPIPSLKEREGFLNQAPFIKGYEYLTVQILEKIWISLFKCLICELKSFDNNLEKYLSHYNPSWNQIGRIYLHLAENKTNDDYPFAFLATYTSKLSERGKAQHMHFY